jgi:hypothetical protein
MSAVAAVVAVAAVAVAAVAVAEWAVPPASETERLHSRADISLFHVPGHGAAAPPS